MSARPAFRLTCPLHPRRVTLVALRGPWRCAEDHRWWHRALLRTLLHLRVEGPFGVRRGRA